MHAIIYIIVVGYVRCFSKMEINIRISLIGDVCSSLKPIFLTKNIAIPGNDRIIHNSVNVNAV